MPLGMEVSLGPGDFVRWGPSYPQKKTPIPAQLWPNGWMDEDATGTEVDLCPGHIILDGVPALRKTGRASYIHTYIIKVIVPSHT